MTSQILGILKVVELLNEMGNERRKCNLSDTKQKGNARTMNYDPGEVVNDYSSILSRSRTQVSKDHCAKNIDHSQSEQSDNNLPFVHHHAM